MLKSEIWINIYALVFSLGFKSVNALEDAVNSNALPYDGSKAERIALIDALLFDVGATPLDFA